MQRSLGLRSGAKLAGQAVVGGVFALLAIRFPDGYDLTPASTHLSFLADFGVSIGPVFFVVWVIIMVAGTSNGVNLTDGLDGLATGTAILVFAAYMIIGIWQLRNDCTVAIAPACYDVRDPQDIAVVAATVMGACAGFLWWNAPPAKIFMGDTGSLALGGALAGLAITTRTELLLLLLGGLFVIITLSVVIQVGSYKMTGKRVFRMAPLQHHFELAGWAETTIVVRFWIIAGICVALGLGIFYVGLDPNHPNHPLYHPSPKHPAPAHIVDLYRPDSGGSDPRSWSPRLPLRRRRSGEGAERIVQGGAGEPVGQGGHRVGADPEYYLECVLAAVAAGEKGPQRLLAHLARGVEDPEGEHADRFEAFVGERPGLRPPRDPQPGDDARVGAERGQPRGVHGHADMAAVSRGDRHNQRLAGHWVKRRAFEDRVELDETVEQVRRGRHPGRGGRKVAEMLLSSGHRPAGARGCGLDGVINEHAAGRGALGHN
jgi:phospho-N-acetylmuramoyl-pentapeptide-transferase